MVDLQAVPGVPREANGRQEEDAVLLLVPNAVKLGQKLLASLRHPSLAESRFRDSGLQNGMKTVLFFARAQFSISSDKAACRLVVDGIRGHLLSRSKCGVCVTPPREYLELSIQSPWVGGRRDGERVTVDRDLSGNVYVCVSISYRYCKNKPYPKSRFCRGVPGKNLKEC